MFRGGLTEPFQMPKLGLETSVLKAENALDKPRVLVPADQRLKVRFVLLPRLNVAGLGSNDQALFRP